MTWLGAARHHVAVCASTMDEADRLAKAGAKHGTVVRADAQTKGRGRRGHTWAAPAGAGLSMSVVLRPQLPPAMVPPITLVTGIALCDVAREFGCPASIKWPNDLLDARGRKLAGILSEMSTRGSDLDYVIVGIGVNLSGVPESVRDIATSISEHGTEVTAAEFMERLLRGWQPWLERFFDQGVTGIADDWRARARLGGVVRCVESQVQGHAVDIDDDGALLIEDSAGVRRRIVAGELSWE